MASAASPQKVGSYLTDLRPEHLRYFEHLGDLVKALLEQSPFPDTVELRPLDYGGKPLGADDDLPLPTMTFRVRVGPSTLFVESPLFLHSDDEGTVSADRSVQPADVSGELNQVIFGVTGIKSDGGPYCTSATFEVRGDQVWMDLYVTP